MFRARWPLVVCALAGCASFASTARAQDLVPGGWSSQVGIQSFRAVGDSGGAGVGEPGRSGVAAASAFTGVPPDWSFAPDLSLRANPQVVHALVPLSDAVRRGVRKRPRR